MTAPPLPQLNTLQQQIQAWYQANPSLSGQTAAQIVAAYTPTVAYVDYWLTSATIYSELGAMYGPADLFARGAAVLKGFSAMATALGPPFSDFWAEISTPGSDGLNIGSAPAQAFIAPLVDPNGSYTPANPTANPPTAAVTSIASGKLLTPQEGQLFASLGTTTTYPIAGVTSIQQSDVTTVLAAITQFNAAQSLASLNSSGQSAAVSLVNGYQNGPTTGTAPTPTQLIQAYAAVVYPGATVTVTAPSGS